MPTRRDACSSTAARRGLFSAAKGRGSAWDGAILRISIHARGASAHQMGETDRCLTKIRGRAVTTALIALDVDRFELADRVAEKRLAPSRSMIAPHNPCVTMAGKPKKRRGWTEMPLQAGAAQMETRGVVWPSVTTRNAIRRSLGSASPRSPSRRLPRAPNPRGIAAGHPRALECHATQHNHKKLPSIHTSLDSCKQNDPVATIRPLN
jgi:hypothetical protein